jgi:two-component system, cell cycle response regulator CtrA
MRILLIEDDCATARLLERVLNAERFNADTAELGQDGIEVAKRAHHDLILLDLNLPDLSGFDVLRSLRADKVMTPVMILSGLIGVEDKVRGFSAGADDYMTKPFARDELVARIHAILRRSKGGQGHSIIQTGDLAVNLDTKSVQVRGTALHLTKKEYELLEFLSLRKGTTLSKESLLSHLYGGLDEPELKIIDVFMCKLRKKLAKVLNAREYLETVWGCGYKLHEPGKEEASLW